jgi:glycosyltransferase involved in cell wall biosynthesis
VKIALIGSRGIPARYSGFEQFYEQFAIRLAERGHEVTVYNRSHFIKDVKKEYKGVRIVSLPSIPTKHLDTITHTFLSSLHALFQGYDMVYYCIVGNSPLCWIPRMVGAKTLINVDGEDWAREKWSGFAKTYQKWCERVACRCSNVVIADAKGILKRYRERYSHETIFVPYGANIRPRGEGSVDGCQMIVDKGIPATQQRTANTQIPPALQKWNLMPENYIFYVGRFVPENAIDLLIRAYKRLDTGKKLVLVGDAPYTGDYKRHLKELAGDDERIVFTGYAFDEDYRELSSNAYLYVQPAGIDGTRPALLDQMGFGNCVLVRNSAVNMEVIGDCGCFFDKDRLEDSLVEVLQELIEHPQKVTEYRSKVTSRIQNYYNWEWVTSFYEDLFARLKEDRPAIQYDEYIALT